MRKSAGVREGSEVRLWTWSSLIQAPLPKKKEKKKKETFMKKLKILDFWTSAAFTAFTAALMVTWVREGAQIVKS